MPAKENLPLAVVAPDELHDLRVAVSEFAASCYKLGHASAVMELAPSDVHDDDESSAYAESIATKKRLLFCLAKIHTPNQG